MLEWQNPEIKIPDSQDCRNFKSINLYCTNPVLIYKN
jgi:hypothetical protein